MHVITSFEWTFGTVCGWAGAGFMCTTLEMLHALTGASADSIMDVWVAILTVEMHADRAVDRGGYGP